MRILFIADAVGVPGRRAVEDRLPALRDELHVDLCILNGENLADGVGITPKLADKMLASGVDAITLGNHVWRRGEIVPYLKESERVIRPANLSRRAPGRGLAFVTAADGTEVAVANLIGSLFIGPPVGSPVTAIRPVTACARRSYAGRSAASPAVAKPPTTATTRPG